MKLTNMLTIGALITSFATPSLMAANSTITPVEKKEFENLIHNYLVNNPDVLLEASQALQNKQQKSQQQEAMAAIMQNSHALLDEKLAVAGNPNGSVTVVEFFDYQCGHCKEMKSVFTTLIKNNSELRVVYKEFPIFGKTSEIGARAALAAAMQGKYIPMHDALLSLDKHLDEKIVLKTAKSLGLDIAKLKVDMNSAIVTDELASNRKLAEKLHLMGTPGMVVLATDAQKLREGFAPAFIPGAANVATLQALITKNSSTK